jgi:hypothetical protein
VAVTQSVQFACGLKATEFVNINRHITSISIKLVDIL